MTAHRFLRDRNLGAVLAGAAVLLWAGLTPAAAQFPPPPGQSAQASQGTSPFPPPGAQQQRPQQQAPASNPFPAPGQASVSPGGFAPGGFGGAQQGGFVRPGGFTQPPSGMGPPPGAGQPSEAQKVCLTFPALRAEVEKGAAGIRSASERKASREEVCPLFKAFALKEAKLVSFLTTNQKLCGVPPNIISQVKQNHAKTIQIRNNVCSTAPSAPAGPTFQDVLGGPTVADDTSVKPGRGTFDTLTGNALQR